MNISNYNSTALSALAATPYTSPKSSNLKPAESPVPESTKVSLSSSSQSGYLQSEAAKELEEYMNMSDSEKFQWHWLNSHGITKEEFNSMSGEERQKIVDQMKEELKQKADNTLSSQSI
ncbi:hypothetical protein LG200_05660 [Methylobacillus caricis]|uniref:hypothetical protein n=1 Tax=Methylobacillus caricis TaxID=1971611 RepID=UPI001CFF8F38|nr:hypothetical protein [Methylobacillus caricis]MCB5187492.1 hypothetical protein [Methylobacillus caricis]